MSSITNAIDCFQIKVVVKPVGSIDEATFTDIFNRLSAMSSIELKELSIQPKNSSGNHGGNN